MRENGDTADLLGNIALGEFRTYIHKPWNNANPAIFIYPIPYPYAMGKYFHSFDGTRLFYIHHKGKLPHTLLFLHGVGGNWTVWKKEIEHFQNKGYSTLTFDMRGHGQSDAPEPFQKYQVPHFTRDIYGLLQKLRIPKFTLIGHSLGGAIAINYCMSHKRKYPTSLILVESASTFPYDHNRLLNMRPYVTHLLRFIASHKLTRKHHFKHFKDVDLSMKGMVARLHLISHLMHLTPLCSLVRTLDNVEKYAFKNQGQIDRALKHLKIPTLVIAGEKDRVIPPKFSFLIKRLDKRAELRILKGAHRVIIHHAEEVSKAMEGFLRKNRI